jgi:Ca2+-binding RTX toxin-like protein
MRRPTSCWARAGRCLDGAAGADLIRGGQGLDTLTGGLGNDIFRFQTLAECGDVITDFLNVAGDNDKFQIVASAFGGGLVAGALAATQFQSRADNVAQDADDRFIFRTTDRTLWFDADGNGAGAAIAGGRPSGRRRGDGGRHPADLITSSAAAPDKARRPAAPPSSS